MSLGRDTIVTLGTSLPPSLGVFGRPQVVLARTDTDLDDVVKLLRIDPALTFQIIRLANSALFGLKHRCESLEEAVARIGFGDIHQMVGLVVSRQVFQGELKQCGIPAGRLWENAVASATLGAELATMAGVDARHAYTTGLLRNLGKIILNNFSGGQRYPGEAAQPDVQAWEKSVHGVTALEASAILLEHWRFSPESVAAVQGQREPEKAVGHEAAAARSHLACALLAGWGCALPGETVFWRADDPMLELAGVTRAQLPLVEEQARSRFSECAQIEWSCAA
jgi:HD-like signal output (HDOD) protein